jgi:hypothetical protein
VATASTRLASHGGFLGKVFFAAARGFYFYSARSIAVENTNDAGKVACNKPEAQAKGI